MRKKGFYLVLIVSAIFFIILSHDTPAQTTGCCVKPTGCTLNTQSSSCVGGTFYPGDSGCAIPPECKIGCCCNSWEYPSDYIQYQGYCTVQGGEFNGWLGTGSLTTYRTPENIQACTNTCGTTQTYSCLYPSCESAAEKECYCGNKLATAGQYCCAAASNNGGYAGSQSGCQFQAECIPPTYDICGTVVNAADNSGIQGASVSAAVGTTNQQITTQDTSGTYTLGPFPDGSGTITAAKSGYVLVSGQDLTFTINKLATCTTPNTNPIHLRSQQEICNLPSPSRSVDYDDNNCPAAYDSYCGGRENRNYYNEIIQNGCSNTDANGIAIDNDCDGLANCADSADCSTDPACITTDKCSDGINNEATGTIEIDSCTDSIDYWCGGKETSCKNNIDDDCDSNRDCADSDCAIESTTDGCCSDGKDNDNNGRIDSADYKCGGTETSCSNNYDDDGDAKTDCLDPDCSGSAGCPLNYCASVSCEQANTAACLCYSDAQSTIQTTDTEKFCCMANKLVYGTQLGCYNYQDAAAQNYCAKPCKLNAEISESNNYITTPGDLNQCRCGGQLISIPATATQYCCADSSLTSSPQSCPAYVETTTISGYIYEQTELGQSRIKDATVYISKVIGTTPYVIGTTQSATDGTYSFTVDKQNTYRVSAQKGGYHASVYTDSSGSANIVVGDSPVANINIELLQWPEYSLGGKVKDSNSLTLIPGATVKIFGVKSEETLTTIPPIEGKDVNYLFKSVPEGTYTVEVSKEGYETTTITNVILGDNNYNLNIDLTPKKCTSVSTTESPYNLAAAAVAGSPDSIFTWSSACTPERFNIYRCPENDKTCTNLIAAVTPSEALVLGENYNHPDTGLQPDTTYCYYVTASYPSFIKSADAVCITTGNELCMNSGILRMQFCNGLAIDNTCTKDGNCIYSCDSQNIAQFGKECNNDYCMENRATGTAVCEKYTDCAKCNTPFGIFGTIPWSRMDYISPITNIGSQELCENVPFCYYDYTETAVDKFHSCKNVDECYDYRSEAACTQNKCLLDVCEWNDGPYKELGQGVCAPVEEEKQKCNYCDELSGYNDVFGACSKDTCTLYGACYYDQQGFAYSCRHKRELSCNDFDTAEDCINTDSTGQVNVDVDVVWDNLNAINEITDKVSGTNRIITRSNDYFNFGVCRWEIPDQLKASINTPLCYKDADDNLDADNYVQIGSSFDPILGKDMKPPVTTVAYTPYTKDISLLFTVADEDSNPADTTLWFCQVKKEEKQLTTPCYLLNTLCYPSLIAQNKVVDSTNLPIINEDGTFCIAFFAEDPSHNLEEIDSDNIVEITKDTKVTADITYDKARHELITGMGMWVTDLTIKLTITDEPQGALCSARLLKSNQNIEPPKNIKTTLSTPDSPSADVTYQELEDGFYVYKADCTDQLGNTVHLEKEILLDADPTIIHPTNPSGTILTFLQNSWFGFYTLNEAACKWKMEGSLSAGVFERIQAPHPTEPSKTVWKHYKDVYNEINNYLGDANGKNYLFNVGCTFPPPTNNQEYYQPLTIKDTIEFAIDRNPPLTAITVPGAGSTTPYPFLDEYQQAHSFKLFCQDLQPPEQKMFGCDKTYACITSEAECTPIENQEFTAVNKNGYIPTDYVFTISSETENKICYYSSDKGSNKEGQKCHAFKVDRTPPEITIGLYESDGTTPAAVTTGGKTYIVKLESSEPLKPSQPLDLNLRWKVVSADFPKAISDYTAKYEDIYLTSTDNEQWSGTLQLPVDYDIYKELVGIARFFVKAVDSHGVPISCTSKQDGYCPSITFNIDTKGPCPPLFLPSPPEYTGISPLVLKGIAAPANPGKSCSQLTELDYLSNPEPDVDIELYILGSATPAASAKSSPQSALIASSTVTGTGTTNSFIASGTLREINGKYLEFVNDEHKKKRNYKRYLISTIDLSMPGITTITLSEELAYKINAGDAFNVYDSLYPAGHFEISLNLNEGDNAYYSVATDSLGNKGSPSSIYHTYYDQNPPRVILKRPDAGEITATKEGGITAIISDSETELQAASISMAISAQGDGSIDSGTYYCQFDKNKALTRNPAFNGKYLACSWPADGKTVTITYTPSDNELKEDTYTVTLTARDTAGTPIGESEATYSFEINSTALQTPLVLITKEKDTGENYAVFNANCINAQNENTIPQTASEICSWYITTLTKSKIGFDIIFSDTIDAGITLSIESIWFDGQRDIITFAPLGTEPNKFHASFIATTTPSSLGEGSHILTINALKKAGENILGAGVYAFRFTADTVNPEIAFNDGITNKNPMPVSGTYFDNNIWYVEITGDEVETTSAVLSLPAFNADVVLKNQINGEKTLTASAFDKAGNSAGDSATYVYDTTPPVISGITLEKVFCDRLQYQEMPIDADCITGGTNLGYKEITVSGNVNEISDVRITVAKTTGTASTTVYSVQSGNLNYNADNSFSAIVRLPYTAAELENYYVIAVVAADLAGNANSGQKAIYLERIPPTITLKQPPVIYPGRAPPEAFTNDFVNYKPIQLETDEYAKCSITAFALTYIGTDYALLHSTTIDSVIGEGRFDASFTCEDRLGNIAVKSYKIIVDRTIPLLNVISSNGIKNENFESGTIAYTINQYENSLVQTTLSVLDNNNPPDNLKCSFACTGDKCDKTSVGASGSFSNAEYSLQPTLNIIFTASDPNGEYKYTITCHDEANNEASQDIFFMIDVTVLLTTLIREPSECTNNLNPLLYLETNLPATCQYKPAVWSSLWWKYFEQTRSYIHKQPISSLTEKEYSYQIMCTADDGSGRKLGVETDEFVDFRVDITPPHSPAALLSKTTGTATETTALPLQQDNAPYYNTIEGISLSWTEPDDICGIDKYSYKLVEIVRSTQSIIIPDTIVEETVTEFSPALQSGEHLYALYLKSKDSAGNWGSYTPYYFGIDTAPPNDITLSIAPNPTNGAVTVSGRVTKTGGSVEKGAAVEIYVTKADNTNTLITTAITDDTGGYSASLTPTAESPIFTSGSNIITVKATDRAGNGPVEKTGAVDYIPSPPEFVSATPPAGSILPPDCRFVSENGKGIFKAVLKKIDNAAISSESAITLSKSDNLIEGTPSINLNYKPAEGECSTAGQCALLKFTANSLFEDGSYTAAITAKDSIGNTAAYTSDFTIKTGTPCIIIEPGGKVLAKPEITGFLTLTPTPTFEIKITTKNSSGDIAPNAFINIYTNTVLDIGDILTGTTLKTDANGQATYIIGSRILLHEGSNTIEIEAYPAEGGVLASEPYLGDTFLVSSPPDIAAMAPLPLATYNRVPGDLVSITAETWNVYGLAITSTIDDISLYRYTDISFRLSDPNRLKIDALTKDIATTTCDTNKQCNQYNLHLTADLEDKYYYRVEFNSKDSIGHEQLLTSTKDGLQTYFFIDKSAPTVYFSETVETELQSNGKLYRTSNSVLLTGHVESLDSITALTMAINNNAPAQVTITGSESCTRGTWKGTCTYFQATASSLLPGDNNLEFIARDSQQRVEDRDIIIRLPPTIEPTVTITNPPSGKAFIKTTISGTYENINDEEIKEMTIYYGNDNTQITSNDKNDGSFAKTLVLDEGINEVYVLLKDLWGELTESNHITLEVEKTAPYDITLNPLPEATRASPIRISGNVKTKSGANAPGVIVEIVLQNGAATSKTMATTNASGDFSKDISLTLGQNTQYSIRVYVVEKVGTTEYYSASETDTVWYITSIGAVSIVPMVPTRATYNEVQNIIFTIETFDSVDVSIPSITVVQKTWPGGTPKPVILGQITSDLLCTTNCKKLIIVPITNWNELGNGRYEIAYTISDSLGNTKTGTPQFEINKNAPQITVESPAFFKTAAEDAVYYTTESLIKFEGAITSNAYPAGFGVKNIKEPWSFTEPPFLAGTGVRWRSEETIDTGLNEILFWVRDDEGRLGQKTVFVKKMKSDNTVRIDTPGANSVVWNSQNIYVHGTFAHDIDEVARIELEVDGATYTAYAKETKEFEGLVNINPELAQHTITVKLYDKYLPADDYVFGTVTFTYGGKPPYDIVISTPAAVSRGNNKNLQISGTVYDVSDASVTPKPPAANVPVKIRVIGGTLNQELPPITTDTQGKFSASYTLPAGNEIYTIMAVALKGDGFESDADSATYYLVTDIPDFSISPRPETEYIYDEVPDNKLVFTTEKTGYFSGLEDGVGISFESVILRNVNNPSQNIQLNPQIPPAATCPGDTSGKCIMFETSIATPLTPTASTKYEIRYTVADTLGNREAKTGYYFRLDPNGPRIHFITPEEFYDNRPELVSGWFTQSHLSSLSFVGKLEGPGVTSKDSIDTSQSSNIKAVYACDTPYDADNLDNEVCFTTALSLTDRKNNIQFKAVDIDGREGMKTVTVWNKPAIWQPEITVIQPADGYISWVKQVALTASYSYLPEEINGNIKVYLNGTALGGITPSASQQFTVSLTLKLGNNTIVIEIKDKYGITTTKQLTIYYGGVPPLAVSLAPITPPPTNNPRITISGSVINTAYNSAAAGIKVKLYKGDTLITTPTPVTTDIDGKFVYTGYSLPTTPKNSPYIIRAIATIGDNFDSQPAAQTVWYVSQIPQTNVLFPAAGTKYNGVEKVILQADEADSAHLTVSNMRLSKIGGGSYNIEGTAAKTSCDGNCVLFTSNILSTLPTGTYRVDYSVNDDVQPTPNTASRYFTFVVDTSAPSINVNEPSEFTNPAFDVLYYTGDSITISGLITSPIGIQYTASQLSSTTINSITDCYPASPTEQEVCFTTTKQLNEGLNEAVLDVTDMDGRYGQRTLKIKTPPELPTITIIEPESDRNVLYKNLVISGEHTFDYTDLFSITLYVNDVPYSVDIQPDQTFEKAIPLELGENKIHAVATDKFYRTVQSNTRIIRYWPDNFPYIPYWNQGLLSKTNANTITLSGYVTDRDGAPQANVEVEIKVISTTIEVLPRKTTDSEGKFSLAYTFKTANKDKKHVFELSALAGDAPFYSEPKFHDVWWIKTPPVFIIEPNSQEKYHTVDQIELTTYNELDAAYISILNPRITKGTKTWLPTVSNMPCGEGCREFNLAFSSPLTENGKYAFTYTVDNTIWQETKTHYFTIDSSSPQINVLSPQLMAGNTYYTTQGFVLLEGTIWLLEGSTVSNVLQHNFDDNVYACDVGTGLCFNKLVTNLQSGANTAELTVTDTKGRTGTKAVTIYKRPTQETEVVIDSPASGATKSNLVVISGHYSYQDHEINSLKLYQNNIFVKDIQFTNQLFTASLTLPSYGIYEIYVVAEDKYGDTTTSDKITIDYKKSICGDTVIDSGEQCDLIELGQFDECTDFEAFSGGTLKCGNDCMYDVTDCRLITCGNSIVEPGEQCEANIPYSLTCNDFDKFNSGSLNCINCRFDTASCVRNPIYTITLTTLTSPTKTPPAISGTVTSSSATVSGVKVEIYINNAKQTTLTTRADGTFSMSYAPRQDGNYEISAYALESDGFKSSPATASFFYITKIPDFTITPKIPAQETYYDVNEIIFEATQTDNAVITLPSVEIKKQGTSTYYTHSAPEELPCDWLNCKKFRVALTDSRLPLGNGIYVIEYTVSDTLQQQARTSTFEINTDAPRITVTSPAGVADRYFTLADIIYFEGTVSGAHITDQSSIKSSSFTRIPSCSNNICIWNQDVDLSSVNGWTDITFSAEDAYSTGRKTVRVYKPWAPAVAITSPQSGLTKEKRQTITGTYNIEAGLIKELYLNANGIKYPLQPAEGQFALSISLGGYGDYPIKAVMLDKFGFSSENAITLNYRSSICGDTIIDPGEKCDSNNLGSKTCSSFGFASGDLSCTASCEFNTASCIPSSCGDNLVNQFDEECDGTDLKHKDCLSFGYEGGTLACSSSCQFDKSQCSVGYCGDNDVNTASERCDGTDLQGKTCQNFDSYISGQLSCNSACSYDLTQCQGPPPRCGDSVVNQITEECDTTDLDRQTCTSFGFMRGTLRCDSFCNFDKSQCIGGTLFCGDNVANRQEEECDGTDLKNSQCTGFDEYTGGTLSCRSNCNYDLTQCTGINPLRCGDNAINVFGEVCDGTDLDNKNCLSFGYEGGTLACSNQCQFDKTGCIQITEKLCGDNAVNQAWEECDGTDLKNSQCTDFDEYTGGTLSCRSNCEYGLTQCTGTNPPRCGDNAVNQNTEPCDGTDLNGKTCEIMGYVSGTLSCSSSCQFNYDNCILDPSVCGDNAVNQAWEECDGTDTDTDCTHFDNYVSGQVSCNSACENDFTQCRKADCGDGRINPELNEQCEANIPYSLTCNDFDKFNSGSLNCINCRFDTADCRREIPYRVVLDDITTPTNSQTILISGRVLDKTTEAPVPNTKLNIEVNGKLYKTITSATGSFAETYPSGTVNKQYLITAYTVESDGFKGDIDLKEVWYVKTIPLFSIYPTAIDKYANVNEIILLATQIDNAVLSITEKALSLPSTSAIYRLGAVAEDTSCTTPNCRKLRIPILDTLNEDGSYYFAYTVTDTLQSAKRTHRFTIDRSAPQVSITLPTVFSNPTSDESLNGMYTIADYMDFTGTITGLYINTKEDVTPVQNNIQTWADCGEKTVCFNSGITLQGGENPITFEVMDKEGLTGSRTVRVFKKPITQFFVSITSHDDNDVEYYKTATISGTFNYNNGDVSYAEVKVNGVIQGRATIDGQTFLRTITLINGSNTITVELRDKWGDLVSDSVTIIYDPTPPDPRLGADCIIGTSSPYYSSCDLVTVSSTTTSPRDTTVTLYIGTKKIGTWSFEAATEPKTFAKAVDILEGLNKITVAAEDAAGKASTSIDIIGDTIPPTIIITKPLDNTITKNNPITVSGTWTDANINRIVIESREAGQTDITQTYIIESPTGTRGSGNYAQQDVALAEGANTITATAYDKANHEAASFVNVILDITLPTITITDVQPATYIASESKYVTKADKVTISGTWYDSTGIKSIKREGTSTQETINKEEKTFAITVSIAAGNNTIVLLAEDAAGNQYRYTILIYRDNTPPSIIDFRPASKTSSTAKPTIQITTDERAGCTIKYPSGELIGQITQSFTTDDNKLNHIVTLEKSLPTSATGSMKKTSDIYLICTDALENSKTEKYSFTVDLKSPQINKFEALNAFFVSETADVKNYILAGDLVTELKITADEETRCRYSQHLTEQAPVPSYGELSTEFDGFDSYSLTPTSQPIESFVDLENYVFYIACEDKGGLTTPTKTINIETNSNLPIQILDPYPLQGSYISNSQPILKVRTLRDVTCTASTSSNNLWFYSKRLFKSVGAEMDFNPETKEHTAKMTSRNDRIAPLTDNPYTVDITCSDTAGILQPASAEIAFTVDTILPVITITSPADGTITNKALVTVAGTVAEKYPDTYMIYVNGIQKLPTPRNLIGDSFSEEIALVEGTEIKVVVNDKAANKGEASVGITYDNIGPTVTILAPNNYGPFKEITKIVAKLTENAGGGGVNLENSHITLKPKNSETEITMTKSTLPEVNTLVYTVNQGLADGEYEITVYPYDLAGNQGQVARSWFKISSACPTITITAPENNFYSNDIFYLWFRGTIATDLTISDANLVFDYNPTGEIDEGDRIVPLTLDESSSFNIQPGAQIALEEGYNSYFIDVKTQQLDYSCQSASQILHLDTTGPIPLITVQTGKEAEETP